MLGGKVKDDLEIDGVGSGVDKTSRVGEMVGQKLELDGVGSGVANTG